MTACRARSLCGAFALLVAACAGGAFAQTTPTLLLPPPREARPATPEAEPEKPTPAETPALRGPAGIEIENARPLDTEGLGLIDAANGGLPADAWAASNRSFAERIVRDLPAPVASMPARMLAIRVLESTAAAPSGPRGANFAALRALKLRQLGDIARAADLAGRIPQRTSDENLLRILIDEAWLSGADERACGLVREAIGLSKNPDFQKALMFCQALAGDATRAQLGLAMLRDQGVPEDAAFVTLLFAVGGDGKGVKVEGLRGASPLTLAMLRAAKVPPPAELAGASDPALLAGLAKGDVGAPELRLAAAERAEAFGAIASPKRLPHSSRRHSSAMPQPSRGRTAARRVVPHCSRPRRPRQRPPTGWPHCSGSGSSAASAAAMRRSPAWGRRCSQGSLRVRNSSPIPATSRVHC